MACHLSSTLRRSSIIKIIAELRVQNQHYAGALKLHGKSKHKVPNVMFSSLSTRHLHGTQHFRPNQDQTYPHCSTFSSKTCMHVLGCRPFSSGKSLTADKVTSKRQDEILKFKDSDICIIFDSSTQVSHLTFAEAKQFANSKKSRLVFMNKNQDGVFCFKLQPASATGRTQTDDQSSGVPANRGRQEKVERKKNEFKEFKIRATIGDHDWKIKVSRIQELLTKGKQVAVLIIEGGGGSANSEKNKSPATFMSEFKEVLGDLCSINQEFSNDKGTRFRLIPKVNDSKTS